MASHGTIAAPSVSISPILENMTNVGIISSWIGIMIVATIRKKPIERPRNFSRAKP